MRTVQVVKTFCRRRHVVSNSPRPFVSCMQFDIVFIVVFPVRNNNNIRIKGIDFKLLCLLKISCKQ